MPLARGRVFPSLGFSASFFAGLTCAVLFSAPAQHARAQCGWQSLPGLDVAGVTQRVGASVTWDPDGAGPILPRAVIAGDLTLAGTTKLSGVAWWDTSASQWRSLQPAGAEDASNCVAGALCLTKVNALFTVENTLVIAGLFSIGGTAQGADELNIAYWTGSAWRAVGVGASNVSRGLPFTVNAAGATSGGLMLAACTDGLYKLTGSLVNGTWTLVNTDFFNLITNEIIDVQGTLVRIRRPAGFAQPDSIVERWNGLAFEPVSAALTTGVVATDATVVQGALHVAFSNLFGDAQSTIGRLEGSDFVQVGSAIDGEVRKLVEHAGSLFALGQISQTSGGETRGIARFVGNDWQPIGPSTLSESRPGFGATSQVVTGTSANNLLFVGGEFVEAGPTQVANIAAFDGAAWLQVPAGNINGPVGAMEVDADGSLVVSGSFTLIGGVQSQRIARFTPSTATWSALGSGLATAPIDITRWQGPTGSLLIAATDPIRAWDGATWQDFGQPIVSNPLNEGVNRIQVYENELYALGRRMLGSFSVLRCDGEVWGPIWTNDAFDSVYCLTKLNDQTLGGGSFPANQFATNIGVSVVDEGFTWQDFGENPPHFLVSQLTPFRGELVATGFFARGSTPVNVEAFDGASWRVLGGGTSSGIASAEVFENDLVVGGRFVQAGQTPVANLARWDGSTWSAFSPELRSAQVGGALDGVSELLTLGDTLFVSGSFTSAGSVVGLGLAAWKDCAGATCDSIDFNGDGLFPDDNDVIDFLAVFAGGTCSTGLCGDIDFNNDELFPDDNDVLAFLRVLAGGDC